VNTEFRNTKVHAWCWGMHDVTGTNGFPRDRHRDGVLRGMSMEWAVALAANSGLQIALGDSCMM
jgi:hypothetical protein